MKICVVCGDKGWGRKIDTVTGELQDFCRSCYHTTNAVQRREAYKLSDSFSGKGAAEKLCPRCNHAVIYHSGPDCRRCGGLCI